MPRIERYTRGIIKPRAVADTVNPQAIQDAGSGFRAVAEVAGAGAEVADRFVQAHELTATNEAIIKSKKQKMDFLEAKRQENMLNPEDFAKRIEPELTKLDAQTEQMLPTARAKKAFREKMMADNFSIYGENFQWERQRRVEKFAESLEVTANELEGLAVRYAQEGKDVSELMANADASAVAGSTFMTPEAVSKSQRTMRSNIAKSYIGAMIEKNPYEAKQLLDTKRFDADLAGDLRGQYIYIDNKIKQVRKEADEASVLKSFLAMQRLADPANNGDRKIINKAYMESGLMARVQDRDIDAISELVTQVERTSIIPEAAQSQIRGWMYNGDRDQRSAAYSIINQIAATKPDALTGAGGFSKAEITDATSYNGLILAGADPDFADKVIRDAKLPTTQAVADTRKNELSEIKKETSPVKLYEKLRREDSLSGNLIQDWTVGWFNRPKDFLDDNNKQIMSANFERVFDAEFMRTGNKDAAANTAYHMVSGHAGVSAISGDDRYMQYPPENYYSVPTLSREENQRWMRHNLKTAVKKIDPNILVENVRLAPVPNAREMVDNGKPPKYMAWYESEVDGYKMMDVIRDENNQPMVMAFDKKIGLEVAAKHKAAKVVASEKKRDRTGIIGPVSLLKRLSGYEDYIEKKESVEKVWRMGVNIEEYSDDEYNKTVDELVTRMRGNP